MRTRAFALAIILFGACDSGTNADATAKADKVWNERCVSCHGTTGRGDGPGAVREPKPRSFADPAWQATADDERIRTVIVRGGAAVGLDPAMAPNPDLAGKDEVLDALVKKIRKFRQ
jgi:mono/diheme cytochrome c family protein